MNKPGSTGNRIPTVPLDTLTFGCTYAKDKWTTNLLGATNAKILSTLSISFLPKISRTGNPVRLGILYGADERNRSLVASF
ncbi:hypothetical protein SpAn4DRAFT_4710 [Sporomusa ovata]|uniref:Uncharacterized protein n=1 Tax=Sporomusa ovata TaxID=2378 RepID=A0A0U1KRZ7_9FIRM|nr:hypothetical protein [Sporomusa ovata]CQR70198.1 hypothetical protein SpAn4DRAFT_4710 [Sporomusa ovata]